MGVLTGTNYDARVRAILGAVDTNMLSTAQLLEFTNAAYIDDVCGRYDLDELDKEYTGSSTAASTDNVTFGMTDCLVIKDICRTSDGVRLKRITSEQFSGLLARSGADTGTPEYWYRTSSSTSGTFKAFFYPMPDAVYALTVIYRLRPSDLDAASATVIDSRFDQPIVCFCASRSAMHLRMYEDAAKLRKYAQALLEDALGISSGISAYVTPFVGQNLVEEMS